MKMSFMVQLGLVGLVGLIFIGLSAGLVPKAQVEMPPVTQRSLERIDYLELHTFGGSGLYLYRVMTCYYVVAFGDNSVAIRHLESCPSASHRKPDNAVHLGDPIIGRPLGESYFGGVINNEPPPVKKN